MALTNLKVSNATQGPKDYKLFDGNGLFLLVTSKGRKYWRQKYRFHGKEKSLSHGVYPEVTLKQARILVAEARQDLLLGRDPSLLKKIAKIEAEDSSAATFKLIAEEWLSAKSHSWADSYTSKIQGRLRNYIYPHLGPIPIREIKTPVVLNILKSIEKTGLLETTHRVRQIISYVMRYAIVTSRAESDPTAHLSSALKRPKKNHYAAIIDPQEVGRLLVAIKGYKGSYVVSCALKLSALFFCRPGELRRLEWSDINLKSALIEIPAERMKSKNDHIIPLSEQAVRLITELKNYSGHGKYVLPSPRGMSRPLSENGVRTALRTMGYDNTQMTAHGFRAMARTLLDEVLGERTEYIERQLAHAVRDPNGEAYNRTKYLEQRRKMMQRWADYLDELEAGSGDYSGLGLVI